MTPELMIYDAIGAGFFYEGVTVKAVNRFLRENADAEEISVRIHSGGGDAFEGVAIMNALKRHPARMVVEIDGLAASAASIIAMAGDEIRMAKGTMMMIHEAWAFVQGPAEDMERTAEMLRKLNGEMSGIYSARTAQTEEECLKMMAAET